MNKIITALLQASLLNPIVLSAGYCTNLNDDDFNEIIIHAEDGSDIDIIISFEDEGSLLQKYMRSIVPSLLVGGSTGALSAFFDHIAPDLWVLTWVIALAERHSLINSISDDMKRSGLTHHKSLMDLCSFASSWLLYYKIYKEMHGFSPFLIN